MTGVIRATIHCARCGTKLGESPVPHNMFSAFQEIQQKSTFYCHNCKQEVKVRVVPSGA